jgi:hypothetical protein
MDERINESDDLILNGDPNEVAPTGVIRADPKALKAYLRGRLVWNSTKRGTFQWKKMAEAAGKLNKSKKRKRKDARMVVVRGGAAKR